MQANSPRFYLFKCRKSLKITTCIDASITKVWSKVHFRFVSEARFLVENNVFTYYTISTPNFCSIALPLPQKVKCNFIDENQFLLKVHWRCEAPQFLPYECILIYDSSLVGPFFICMSPFINAFEYACKIFNANLAFYFEQLNNEVYFALFATLYTHKQ